MFDVKNLLSISFSPVAFAFQARECISVPALRAQEKRQEYLEQLTSKLSLATQDKHVTSNIPAVFRKFKAAAAGKGILTLSRREIRVLAFALYYSEVNAQSILSSPWEVQVAINQLGVKWMDGFLPGLIIAYLRNWKCCPAESMSHLHKAISTRLASYRGRRPSILALQSAHRFLDPANGDLLLGAEIALRRQPVFQAVRRYGFAAPWSSYPYFHGVLIAYYEKSKSNLSEALDEIHQALLQHSSGVKGTWTSTLLISKMILQTARFGLPDVQERVKEMAFQLLGDPAASNGWSCPTTASTPEREEVARAQQILNEWITQRFITVFFEICLDDPRRKAFWLGMAKHVTAFKVFGSSVAKRILMRDERVKDFVTSRYQVTGGTSNVSAILMRVRDYVLVEFSETGWAFYAYQQGSPVCPRLDKHYQNISDLRNTSMPNLLKRQGRQFYEIMDEGGLGHRDGELLWEDVFRYWIERKLGIQ